MNKKSKTFKKILSVLMATCIFTMAAPSFNLAFANDGTSFENQMDAIVKKYEGENLQIKNGFSLYVGESLNYMDLLPPEGADVNFIVTSNDESIVKIDENKNIIALTPGETYITLKADFGTFLYQISVEEETPIALSSYEKEGLTDYGLSVYPGYRVYVDAGHGGKEEPGANGFGRTEKDITLSIALKVEMALKAKGVDVVMRRNNDSYMDFRDIGPHANTTQSDAFVSIHTNAFNGAAYGIETYYSEREESKKLADSVQNKLITNTGAFNRGVKNYGFNVVASTIMPSALVETGFIDNISESAKLGTSSYQQLLADAMANGIYDYLKANVTIVDPIDSERIFGLDRYETSYKVANLGWNTADTVIIAPGANFPDALCSAPLAKKYDAPILLAENCSINSQQGLKDVLLKLNAKKAIIVGGTTVLSNIFETDLSTMGISSERIAGSDRYETAAKIAEKIGTTGEIALASGENFPDALSISSIAAQLQMPILLTKSSEYPDATKQYVGNNSISKTYIIGGTTVIPNNISALQKSPCRLEGLNRYSTNEAIFNNFKDKINLSTGYMARGNAFPDALSVSPLAGKNSSFVFLCNEKELEAPLENMINTNRNSISKMYILGGSAFITDKTLIDLGIKY
ncbi:MAG: cell wall-binding repeat-containing protein [Clostridium sp.]|nr:cell wall-binding repeat-containing protein [Clostridium sp.]